MQKQKPQPAAPRRLLTLSDGDIESLCELLIDCVARDASVGFLHPVSVRQALNYWREVGDKVKQGDVALLVVEDEGGIVGTVQIILRQPDNQAHRAHISKLLVHYRGRRHGIGTALMAAAEDLARSLQKSLLDLDTAIGPSELFYHKLGWCVVGTVPGYALSGKGVPCDYRFFFRRLT
jgi:GNAT superfamily N-acetyltransferase